MDVVYTVNIEKSILCSIFFEPLLIEELSTILHPSDFYLKTHSVIYETMIYLYQKDLPIDEDFVIRNVKDKTIDLNVIAEILSVNAISNVMVYAYELKENSKKRQINSLAIEIKRRLMEDEYTSEELLSYINNEINTIENNSILKEPSSKDIIEELKGDMEKASKNLSILGQKSGLKALDKIIGAFEDGDLIVIAARPSMGKTSIISTITIQSLQDGDGVLIETLEMPSKKIMSRLISAKSSEKLSDLKKGLVSNIKNFEEAVNFFACEKLVLHDNTYPSIMQLQSRIKKVLRNNKNIKNVFIDHTGKIRLDGKTREDIEIGHITNMLKKIARDFNVRVFLLQQLNRSVESRENKRPMLSDLKNSGNIEEDADVVLGLYRESYYKSKEKSISENDIENAEIIVLKNRDGETGIAKVSFEGRCARFIDRKELNIPVTIEYGE